MEYDLTAGHILSLSPGPLSQRMLNALATVLLLVESAPDKRLAYKGFDEGRYRLDSQLVDTLLKTASKKVQWAIVNSPAFWCLPTQTYRHHFFRFWRMRRRYGSWRCVLGKSLVRFLPGHPHEAPVYAKVIWTLIKDSDRWAAIEGLNCAGYLGSTLTLKQAKRLLELTADADVRMKAFAAKSQIGNLYKHFNSLKPEVKAFFLDPRTVDALRIRHDPSDTDQWGAHGWCMMNMNKVLRRRGAPV